MRAAVLALLVVAFAAAQDCPCEEGVDASQCLWDYCEENPEADVCARAKVACPFSLGEGSPCNPSSSCVTNPDDVTACIDEITSFCLANGEDAGCAFPVASPTASPTVQNPDCCSSDFQHPGCPEYDLLDNTGEPINYDGPILLLYTDANPSVTFTFPSNEGSLWGLMRCTTEEDNSWYVNGDLWSVPVTSDDDGVYEWREFGDVDSAEVEFAARESNCLIGAVYLGDADPSTLGFTVDQCAISPSASITAEPSPSASVSAAPTPQNPDCCATEFQHPGCAEFSDLEYTEGDAVYMGLPEYIYDADLPSVTFTFPSNVGSLWGQFFCPDEVSNSWYVDGTTWDVPVSEGFSWTEFGAVTGAEVEIAVREPDCVLRALYLGTFDPNNLALDVEDCAISATPSETPSMTASASASSSPAPTVQNPDCCAADFQRPGCADFDSLPYTSGPAVYSGSIRLTYSDDLPSMTYSFPDSTGSLWGYVRCTSVVANSWYVNGNVWDIMPTLALAGVYEWREYGAVGSTEVELAARESNCFVAALYLGDRNPNELVDFSVDNCVISATPSASPSVSPTVQDTDCCNADFLYPGCGEFDGLDYVVSPVVWRGEYLIPYNDENPSFTVTFPENVGTLWGFVRCPTLAANSWYVNGNLWDIRRTRAGDFRWREFGPVSSATVEFTPREPGCAIRSLYLGVHNPSTLGFSINNCVVPASPEPTPSVSPVAFDPDCCATGYQHVGCADITGLDYMPGEPVTYTGSRQLVYSDSLPNLQFSFPEGSFPTGSLWGYFSCPTVESDSWFVNGQVWTVALGTGWREFGSVSSDDIRLSVREPNCRLFGLYLGEEQIDTFPWSFDDCIAPTPSPSPEAFDSDCCNTNFQGPFCGDFEGMEYTNPLVSDAPIVLVYSDALPTATFTFPGTAPSGSRLWALARCPNVASNSWWLNGELWNFDLSADFAWQSFGIFGGNNVELSPREPNCEIAALYLGTVNPELLSYNVSECDADLPSPSPSPDATGCCGSEFQPIACSENSYDAELVFDNTGALYWTGTNFYGGSVEPTVTVTFPENITGNLWVKATARNAEHDTWFVDGGSVIQFPITTVPTWFEYGPVLSNVVTFTPRENMAKIYAVYRGDFHPQLLGYSTDFCPADELFSCPACGTDVQSGSCGSNDSLEEDDTLVYRGPATYTFPTSQASTVFEFPSMNATSPVYLWLNVNCPSGVEDSWFVNGVTFDLLEGVGQRWQRFESTITELTLSTREPNCPIFAVYVTPDENDYPAPLNTDC